MLEGITTHYHPRAIHVIAPAERIHKLKQESQDGETAALKLHEEETFFNSTSLTKDRICAELDLGQSLYTPGWFYQQLLKLGAFEVIEGLSEWYVVWDRDLLPVDAWSLTKQQQHKPLGIHLRSCSTTVEAMKRSYLSGKSEFLPY